MTMKRCLWVSDDPLYVAYHDHEWGIPQKDPQALFEMLCLEGQQAGLSWITVLKKREAYRRLFYQFSATRMAQMTDEEIEERLQDASIIRGIGVKLPHWLAMPGQCWQWNQPESLSVSFYGNLSATNPSFTVIAIIVMPRSPVRRPLICLRP